MRLDEIRILSEPYQTHRKNEVDRRFHSSIGADMPSTSKLAVEILHDLDTTNFGISWWQSLPTEERILISDYLFQCANGIETNLVEAKLHYFEWLDARERGNRRIVDAATRNFYGDIEFKTPPSTSPLDDLPNKLEPLHICGFFRAIGSALDCLGAVIVGVLGLPVSLRRSDISKARKSLSGLTASSNRGVMLQLDFRDYFQQLIVDNGAEDWLEWADQYRNMFVHRGRRTIYNKLVSQDVHLLDASGQVIPRVTSTLHLAKYPDRSEVEALLKSKEILLSEDADTTLSGIFKSCRELGEHTCERLLSIWQTRRSDPQLIEQPINQWDDKIRVCNFVGYEFNAEKVSADEMIGNPVLFHRMISASVDDTHRNLWNNSRWNK